MAEPASPTRPASTVDTSDWPAQAADTIERVVGNVRGKTTGPAITVARAVVYGSFALIVGTAAAVVLVIGLVRALDIAIANISGEQHTWAAYMIIGTVFAVVGMVLWRLRKPRSS